ncbi:hypothetical protein [Mycolicibacterium parafortuitum]|uniref:hypothetical protein n=1 Tax=Mycolicibacterium parafortuitum TaxID=39692 RepID=UPI0032C40BC0
MTEAATPPESAVSPDEIWDRVTGINHEVGLALVRRWLDDDEDAPDGEDGAEPEIDLRPSIKEVEPKALTLGLRAEARFPSHLVQFEEAATVYFDDEQEFSTADIRTFGTRVVLPFLLPYVESGFRRMCAEADLYPPPFPYLAVKGVLYSLKESVHEQR